MKKTRISRDVLLYYLFKKLFQQSLSYCTRHTAELKSNLSSILITVTPQVYSGLRSCGETYVLRIRTCNNQTNEQITF